MGMVIVGVLGRARKRTVFIRILRIAIQKNRSPNFLIANPCHRHGHGHRSVFGPSLQPIAFYMNQQNRHPQIFRSRKFLIANTCRCHGHGHRSGLGRSWKLSVFKGINGIVVQNFSAPKIFDSQSMPLPWAWSSFGLFGPSLQADGFYKDPQNRHPKIIGPEKF